MSGSTHLDLKSVKGLSAPTSVPPPPPSSKITSDQPKVIELNGHVGFDSIPHQIVKKCIEQGFQFNLMCVGETGMGKTTLIQSLFNMNLEFEPCNSELKTVELRTKTYDVAEGSIRLKLTLVETAGFGDQLDKDKSAKVIVDYIEAQFEKYLKEELKVKRDLAYYDDTRIHACLYFISPTGHGLKALDVVTLRELAKRVNVIPVIAKSDTTSKNELANFKTKILSELRSHNIEIYHFPTDDETVAGVNADMNAIVPFAVVGSNDFVKKENGKQVRARMYPWGIVEVENEAHCDFVKLREALLRTNVDSLRERTHKTLYETYRRDRLRTMRIGDGDAGPKFAQVFKQKESELNEEFSRKEAAMRAEFARKLTLAEEETNQKTAQLCAREKDMEERYAAQLRLIESQIQALHEERARADSKGKKFRK